MESYGALHMKAMEIFQMWGQVSICAGYAMQRNTKTKTKITQTLKLLTHGTKL